MVGCVAPLIIVFQTAFMFMRNHPKTNPNAVFPHLLHAITYSSPLANKILLLIKVCCTHRQTCVAIFLVSIVWSGTNNMAVLKIHQS